jgi:hypothetical protein
MRGAGHGGGYFADPGFKEAPDLHAVGFPIAEVAADGSFTITKADVTGGVVNARTVKEQLLYELHDPAAYLSPDVVADISEAEVVEVGENRVAVKGVRGRPRPETLKATVCFAGGWLGEGEISYAGPNAEARARLAGEVISRRVGDALKLRFDLIGALSVFGDERGAALSALPVNDTRDVRLRVAGVHSDRALSAAIISRKMSPLRAACRWGVHRHYEGIGHAHRDGAGRRQPSPRRTCATHSLRARTALDATEPAV